MRKWLTLILSLALAACVFAGCSSEKAPEEPSSSAQDVWADYNPEFTAEQTYAMSNFMMYGRYVVEDGVVYGLTHDGYQQGALGATPFKMVGDFPEFEKVTILDDRGSANYLTRAGDYLYYILNGSEICRVMLDGSDRKTIYEGTCDYLSIHDDKLYFTDESYHLVCTDMEGGNLTTVVNKAVYYPYFICNDWMVFQDDADNESLHLYNTANATEVNITNLPSYSPILDGSYLYFTDSPDDGIYLNRVDISDPNNFVREVGENALVASDYLIDEAYIYAVNDESVTKEDWQKLSTDDDTTVDTVEMYVSGDYSIHHELDGDGFIIGKYLMSKTEFGGKSFA